MFSKFHSVFLIKRIIRPIARHLTLVYLSVLSAHVLADAETPLGLNQAILMAQDKDPWLLASQHQQDATESLSVAAGSYPDPKLSLSLVNLASDSLDFDQEPMTQIKFGIQQILPRGDSLKIRQNQLRQMAKQYPFQRLDRQAKVSVWVATLWLDAYKAQESISLIEGDRALFEQLVDVAEASYSTAIGRTRQQDIVRAQLELTQLDDRLFVLKQRQEVAMQRLSQWLSAYSGTLDFDSGPPHLKVTSEPSNIRPLQASIFNAKQALSAQQLFAYLVHHPAVKAIDQKIAASNSSIELAEQAYKPEWGISAGYGLRSNASVTNNRSDLLSLGLSFDLPLFTKRRQDKQLAAAVSNTEAIRTKKTLLLRKLMAAFETNRSEYLRLLEREALFNRRLLPQMHDQAEASLTAYTNDDGDFSEVVRARISELNATIDALSIKVDIQKSISQLNYFFIGSQNSPSTIHNPRGA